MLSLDLPPQIHAGHAARPADPPVDRGVGRMRCNDAGLLVVDAAVAHRGTKLRQRVEHALEPDALLDSAHAHLEPRILHHRYAGHRRNHRRHFVHERPLVGDFSQMLLQVVEPVGERRVQDAVASVVVIGWRMGAEELLRCGFNALPLRRRGVFQGQPGKLHRLVPNRAVFCR